MNDAMIARLQRAYDSAVRAEESANTVEMSQKLAVKTERCLQQLRLAQAGNLPPVAKKSARRLASMLENGTYSEIVEFISTHHYGGCACGCGQAVRNLFKQGHDMKLKSRLNRQNLTAP